MGYPSGAKLSGKLEIRVGRGNSGVRGEEDGMVRRVLERGLGWVDKVGGAGEGYRGTHHGDGVVCRSFNTFKRVRSLYVEESVYLPCSIS
jgi:hypothetical protein